MTAGEALCGIETDKAVIDFEIQDEGYIAQILYPDGAKDILLGQVIAILVDEEEDVAAFANYKGEPTEPKAKATSTPEPTKPSAPAKTYPDHIVLEMPNLSPTMEKVSQLSAFENFRGIFKLGIRKLATKSHQVKPCAVLRRIRLFWISRFKMRAMSPRFCTQTAPKTSFWVNLSLSYAMKKKISQHLVIGRQVPAVVVNPHNNQRLPKIRQPHKRLQPRSLHNKKTKVIRFS